MVTKREDRVYNGKGLKMDECVALHPTIKATLAATSKVANPEQHEVLTRLDRHIGEVKNIAEKVTGKVHRYREGSDERKAVDGRLEVLLGHVVPRDLRRLECPLT